MVGRGKCLNGKASRPRRTYSHEDFGFVALLPNFGDFHSVASGRLRTHGDKEDRFLLEIDGGRFLFGRSLGGMFSPDFGPLGGVGDNKFGRRLDAAEVALGKGANFDGLGGVHSSNQKQ